MRNIEEQLNEIEKRSSSIKQERRQRKAVLGVLTCLVLIVALSAYVAGIPMSSLEYVENPLFGSLIIAGPMLGYLIIGFISFLLGITFTMLCLHVKNNNRR